MDLTVSTDWAAQGPTATRVAKATRWMSFGLLVCFGWAARGDQ